MPRSPTPHSTSSSSSSSTEASHLFTHLEQTTRATSNFLPITTWGTSKSWADTDCTPTWWTTPTDSGNNKLSTAPLPAFSDPKKARLRKYTKLNSLRELRYENIPSFSTFIVQEYYFSVAEAFAVIHTFNTSYHANPPLQITREIQRHWGNDHFLPERGDIYCTPCCHHQCPTHVLGVY